VYSLNLNVRKAIFLTLFMCPLILIGSHSLPAPYYLGFDTNPFLNVEKQFKKLAFDHDIIRPTISNADLGIMSWSKEMNIVDLGMLGNHLTARLRGDGAAEYLLTFALPDFIESHGLWSEMYAALFADQRFDELYAHVIDSGDYQKERRFPQGFWVRKDIMKTSGSRERAFLNLLQKNLNSLDIGFVEDEFKSASQHGVETGYISRTVYKYLPEWRQQGKYGSLTELFHASSVGAVLTAYDLYLIEGLQNAKKYSDVIKLSSRKSINLEEIAANVVYTGSKTEPWGRLSIRKNSMIFAHAPSLFYLDLMKHDIYGKNIRIEFGYTDPKGAHGCSDGINFSVYYEKVEGSPIILFEATVRPEDPFARMQTRRLFIPSDPGIRKVFFKAAQLKHNACDWAFWGGFKVEG
jgi:hypothetical protein